jgi:hypothetical protein
MHIICKQLLNANDINRVYWVVLGLIQDRACTDFYENLSENTLKGDLSNATTFNPPLFSLVDTFKGRAERLAHYLFSLFSVNKIYIFLQPSSRGKTVVSAIHFLSIRPVSLASPSPPPFPPPPPSPLPHKLFPSLLSPLMSFWSQVLKNRLYLNTQYVLRPAKFKTRYSTCIHPYYMLSIIHKYQAVSLSGWIRMN